MKKNYLFGAIALSLLFTGCKSDDLTGGESSVSDKSQTLYINMRIHGDGTTGTRASGTNGTPDEGVEGNFDAGTDQESAVNNAYFVFYDEAGNVIGEIVPVELSNPTKVTTPEGTVSEYYKSVVPVSVRKGENKPTQVICYINPISPSTLQNPLSVIQTIARERVSTPINGETFFAMSNSVYYPQEDGGSVPQVAVPIGSEALYETEDDASKGTAIVDIYVERYASKLTFNGPTAANTAVYQTATRKYTGTAYNPVNVSLEFVPQYWAVNAQSNTSYVIKSFRRESQEGQVLADNYPYQTLNYRINVADPTVKIDYNAVTGTTLDVNNSWDWNNPLYHRSYWSVSPAYFQTEYPEVASDVTTAGVTNQTYLTYGELPTKGYAATNNTPQYFKETTVGTKAINSNNPAAAVASVIFVGQYKVSVGGTAVTGNPSFYTYLTGPVNIGAGTEQRPYVYFGNNAQGESTVAGGESMLKRFCAQTTILFKAVTDGAGNTTYTRLGIGNSEDFNNLVGALAVSEISDAVKSKVGTTNNEPLKLQGNARSLQFKSVEEANGIYIASGNGYKTIVADDATPDNSQIRISEANAILMQQVGYAYYYDNGKAYFNIPVKHLGWYRPGNANRTDGVDNPKIDWNKVRVGDFGMVRNHSYSVNVNKITGLASGIAGNNVPIVPPASTTDYYVSYSVRILKWAVVPVQNVDL